MRLCNRLYTIREYGVFTRGVEAQGCQPLPEKTFDALEAFILTNNPAQGTDAAELLSLSARRGTGKVIAARNHVGVITMTNGTVIEILPKIAGRDITDSDSRRIFLEMLKTLKDVAFKNFNVSSLHSERLNLFEIFIGMFLDEVAVLVKQGLKSAYAPLEANERFYKGKLMVAQNIKFNVVNKAQVFVRYDEFNLRRAENRLLKTTLLFLAKASGDGRNRQNAARLLTFFDSVECSDNYDADFAGCCAGRSMSHYSKALAWCRLFLKGNSFTAFAGSEVAIALLFPMEKIFESFVAAKLRKHAGAGVSVRAQDSKYCLFDAPNRAFVLRPDIVLERGGRTVVLDTKWKLLSGKIRNNGIAQADMYQMYAYSKKYAAGKVILIYPKPDSVSVPETRYASDDGVEVRVCFLNLLDTDNGITQLLAAAGCEFAGGTNAVPGNF